MRLSPVNKSLTDNLVGKGAALRLGPLVGHIQISIEELREAFSFLYEDYPVVEEMPADFHVHIRPTHSFIRKFIGRQAIADIDGPVPFVPLPRRLSLIMFEQALNWCTATRGHSHLIFHAGAVGQDARAVLIPGTSGQGKTTLAAGLAGRGWRFFSDEFGMLDMAQHLLFPMPRPISLKNQSIAVIRDFAPQLQMTPLLHGSPKGTMAYAKPPRDAVARMNEGAPISAIVVPQYMPQGEPSLTPLRPAQAFMLLTSCSVNYGTLGEAAFHTLTKLVDEVPCVLATYRNLEEGVQQVERVFAGDF